MSIGDGEMNSHRQLMESQKQTVQGKKHSNWVFKVE